MALQIRRGTDAERTAGGGVIFAEGELIYVTTTDALYVGDGSTAGGVKLTDDAGAVLGSYITADTINSKLDLQQNLDLNGNNVIGTGDINITGNINATGNIVAGGNIEIGDAGTDTLTISAKVDSGITPETDTAYDLGTASLRWRNLYANGATIDGQVDAVAINADVVADDSSVMVNVSNNIFTGAFSGNVTGNVLGDLTGDSAGTHTGDTAGTHTGAVVGNVTGNIVGNVTGDVTGDVKGSGAQTVLAANTGPSDAALSVSTVTATTLSGTLTGNVTGNTAGYHTGDVKGSVFGDDSTVIVDAVNNTLIGNVTGDLTGNVTGDTAGTHTGAVVGNAAGDHTGTFTGNVFTALIDSADSSAITVTPAVVMSSDLTVDNAVSIGGITGVVINDNNISAYSASNPTKLAINSICADANDYTTELVIDSNVNITNDMTVTGKFTAFGDRAITAIHRTALSETNSGFFVTEYAGSVTDAAELQDISNYTIKTKIVEDVADFGTAVKFASMTTSVRNALTPAAGMVVFNTTETKLQVYTGSAWADLH